MAKHTPQHAAPSKRRSRLTALLILDVVVLAVVLALLCFLRRSDKRTESVFPSEPVYEAVSEPSAPAQESLPEAFPTGTPAPEPTPEPAPEPTPEPTPEQERIFAVPQIFFDNAVAYKVDNYVPVRVRFVDEYGETVFEDENASWRVHGNSTARFEKFPYKIRLSSAADLFGMGKGRKFVLLANAYDKTLLRNRLAFSLAKDLGLAYTSECRSVDVYRNGEYRGNYLLIEPVEIGKNRVDIHPAANEFLMEIFMGSYTPEEPRFTSPRLGIRMQLSNLDSVDAEQMAYLTDFFDKAEDALLSGDETAIRSYFDVDSFIDHYIVSELSKNADANFASVRVYLKGGKLYAGPIWDFDLSFGNSSEPCDWRHYYNDTSPTFTDGWYTCSLWWKELVRQDFFLDALAERYREVQPIIVNLYEDNELGQNRIDAFLADSEESIRRNFSIWSVNIRAYYGERISSATYELNLEYMRDWIRQRNEWILAQMAQGGQYITVTEE